MPPNQSDARDSAAWVACQLREAGHKALFAGGCVRDQLVGEVPKDFDIATDATPDEVRAVFPKARAVGEAFGVMLVRRNRRAIEVATFRRDGPYDDHRRPSSVDFADAEADAQRRDFTINGMFQDPSTGEVIDYVDGKADIERRCIRAIGDPDARINEDRLRMLRAVRFAGRLDFSVEDTTQAAIVRHADELRGVSRERIGLELRMILAGPRPATAIAMIEAFGLDAPMLDEPARGADRPLRHLQMIAGGGDVVAGLAAWALDRGDDDPAVVDRWTQALILSNREADHLREVLKIRQALNGWSEASVARQKRLAARVAAFGLALDLLGVAEPAGRDAIARDVAQLAASGLAPEPLIDGDDLLNAGLEPGPAFGQVLTAVYDAQLEGRVATPEAARDLAIRLFGDSFGELPGG